MIDYRFLKVTVEQGVVLVTLARAPANAVHFEMYIEIADAFSRIDALADDVRVAVLSGEGRHFCAGNDLDEFATMTPQNGEERMWRVREAFYAISRCRVPVVGAIQGAALGTGLALAASCDFVVAEPDARFGLPELTVGVMGGARHLARWAPQQVVRRMFFTGQPMTARELSDMGVPINICSPGALMEEAKGFARRIAGFSPTAVRVAKQVLDRIEFMDLEAGYAFEQAATVRMSGHPDSNEALTAFREKREPSYVPTQGGVW